MMRNIQEQAMKGDGVSIVSNNGENIMQVRKNGQGQAQSLIYRRYNQSLHC